MGELIPCTIVATPIKVARVPTELKPLPVTVCHYLTVAARRKK